MIAIRAGRRAGWTSAFRETMAQAWMPITCAVAWVGLAVAEGPGPDGAATEFVLDSAGGHGWPGTPSRRAGNAPIASFRGAERVWAFFEGKARK